MFEVFVKELNDTENLIPLSRDTKPIDYQNAQISR